ncbi:MAG: 4-methyl-5(B-hydroxyethyl)-thiazole monophosphate biosynthesis protein [Anaerolineae bacterium]|nr:4-methyl-5(B-hydroxyethyl)-thiazole monophosphate biosynthesis protein [Anaerolineae bacterium]NIN94933.1 4-methyl-5(B-hydroxyethyl)-thiazole monophosphate biosynthesis protein [Anaerolineae bacterium]NIQ77976.1 4-methyl-5(B-hydroxyethyl)-thiazole monophosphate biosynthesis protein [Anaerolineae bacterium]
MATTEKTALSDKELEYYSRQLVLRDIGYDGQLRLSNASVCIVGLGGLGSPAAVQLAAMGVGHLRLVDYDVVELSNLQRQHLYDTNSLGYPKVEAAAERLGKLNPYIEIEPLPLAVGAHNAQDIVEGMDVVVDGLDRMTPRYALNRACVQLGIPYVFGAAISSFGNVSTIIPGETACLECFQRSVEDDSLPTCAVVGVHPSITSVIASVQVSEAVRIILGQEPQLGSKLLHCDIAHLEFEVMEVARDEDCPACGPAPSDTAARATERLVTELCAREGRRTFVIIPRRDLALHTDRLHSVLAREGFEVKVRAKLGITFDRGPKGTASLLTSGIMIVEDAADEEEAYQLYRQITVEGLNIEPSAIEQ